MKDIKMKSKKNLEYYLNLPWTYKFEWSDVDNCYVASIAELKGCMSDGNTLEEAQMMIRDALKSYITSCLQYNDKIPEPLKHGDFKGNITYRTTPERHYQIAKRAKNSNKTINRLIDEAIESYLDKEAS